MTTFSRLALRLLVLCLALGSISSCKNNDSETVVLGNWTRGNTFPAAARTGAVSFVINNVAYVGTGIDANGNQYNDLFAFNATSNSWTTVTPMPAAAGSRYYAVAFAAAGKGYVGTGYSTGASGTKIYSDFWQFDPTTSTTVGSVTTIGSWKQVADLTSIAGGSSRYYAVASSVADKGYVGCGYDGTSWKKDFYRYDPTTDKWTTFAGFPGDKRAGGFAFTVNGQMYVAGGSNNGENVTDVYAYNPAGDTWAQRNSLINQTTGTTYDNSGVFRVYGAAFVIGDKAYVATGSNGSTLSNVYVYDPSGDTWTLKNPFRGAGRNSAVAFGIGNYGYVGLGGTTSTNRYDNFFKFDPNAAQE